MILGKALILATGIGGLSIVPFISKGFYSFPINRKVFIITKNVGAGVKLFVEEIKKDGGREESEFVLRVLNGREEKTVNKGSHHLKDRFFLCSPKKDKNDYFLLRLDEHSHRYNLSGRTVSECNDRYRSTLGEVLGISVGTAGEVLQKVDLQQCDITKTGTEEKNYALKMTCKELWGSNSPEKKIEILSQSYENLTV